MPNKEINTATVNQSDLYLFENEMHRYITLLTK